MARQERPATKKKWFASANPTLFTPASPAYLVQHDDICKLNLGKQQLGHATLITRLASVADTLNACAAKKVGVYNLP